MESFSELSQQKFKTLDKEISVCKILKFLFDEIVSKFDINYQKLELSDINEAEFEQENLQRVKDIHNLFQDYNDLIPKY